MKGLVRRPPDVPPSRPAVNAMLISAVCVFALHAQRLPWWLTALVVALVGWRYLIDNHARRAPPAVVRLTLVAAVLAGLYLAYGTFIGRDAGVATLAGLVGLKIIELRRLRDYLLSVFLLLFLTLSAFLFDQSLVVGVWAMVLVVLNVATLFLLSQPDCSDMRHAGGVACAILLKAVPLAIAMYLLFPRVEGSLWRMPQSAAQGVSGLTDSIEPGSLSDLVRNDAVAFRVRFEGPVPEHRDRYWRALVLERVRDGRWEQAGVDLPRPSDRLRDVGGITGYEVSLEPTRTTWLPGLDTPVITAVPHHLSHGRVLRAESSVHERIRYRASSAVGYRSGELAGWERRLNVSLDRAPSSRVTALVDTWRERANEAPDRLVQLALEHFRKEPFYYTLTPPLLEPSDPVDDFLFDKRRGFCEHFATTFVSLMRSAGLPARVVVGYQGGEYNPRGGYLMVLQSDAHAWAEVFLPGRGWTRFDPTAAVAPERVELGLDSVRRLAAAGSPLGVLAPSEVLRAIRPGWLEEGWRTLGHYWDSTNHAWNQLVLDYGIDEQHALMRGLGFTRPSWSGVVAVLVGTVGVVLAIIAAWMFRPRRLRDPVADLYQIFCRRLARVGVVRAPNEGPIAFARRASRERRDLSHAIWDITDGYVTLRYGPRPDPALGDRYRAAVRTFRAPSRGPGATARSSSRTG